MSAGNPLPGLRHTRSAATPSASASSQHPHNPHHRNSQAYAQNSGNENYSSQPTTPPRTPRKDNISSSHNKENGSKQRTRNKNRPKNLNTSPAVTRNDRRTPPMASAQNGSMPSSAKPISTPSTAAYAGSTFHASPAPSALPIPSFYSKSVPDSPGLKRPNNPRDVSTSSKESFPSPAFQASNSRLQREESPLDIFFKADREEKARARSASSTQAAAVASGPFQPPFESPRNAHTPPVQRHNHHAHNTRSSTNGIFAMEMDGTKSPGSPYGPAFSTPYSERIREARAGNRSIRSPEQISQDAQSSLDRSEALKAYLFSSSPLPATTTNNVGTSSSTHRNSPQVFDQGSAASPSRSQQINPFSHDSRGAGDVPRTSGRTSGLRQQVSPTKTPERNLQYASSPTAARVISTISSPNSRTSNCTFEHNTRKTSTAPVPSHSVSSGGKEADLQGMEDSLRKILKLDSAGVSGSAIGGVQSASVSIPNCVGGRAPPLNSMHNGVMGS